MKDARWHVSNELEMYQNNVNVYVAVAACQAPGNFCLVQVETRQLVRLHSANCVLKEIQRTSVSPPFHDERPSSSSH